MSGEVIRLNIIEVYNLKFKNIFEDLSLVIPENTIVSISGPNNCGKTTLIRILSREIITENILINGKTSDNYKIEDYSNIIQAVIPKEVTFYEKTIKEELKRKNYYPNKKLINSLKLNNSLNKDISELTDIEIIYTQILFSLLKGPKVLLLDSISLYLNDKEMEELLLFLKKYKEKYNLTIVFTTLNLKDSLYSDYLFIINNGKVLLSGSPIEVLKYDNILNKNGLEIPFIIDLSVKMMDYNLIDEPVLDMDRMVDTIWK